MGSRWKAKSDEFDLVSKGEYRIMSEGVFVVTGGNAGIGKAIPGHFGRRISCLIFAYPFGMLCFLFLPSEPSIPSVRIDPKE